MLVKHLIAAVMAIGLLASALVGFTWYAHWLESEQIHAIAPKLFDLRNQGTELQAAAFQQSDLLVIYGSSELEMPDPYHASTVFQHYRRASPSSPSGAERQPA